MANVDVLRDHSRRLALHPLVYLVEGDEVTIGRRDIDSYAIFPSDGAEIVRRLGSGDTPVEVARWYEATYGVPPDIDHVLAALDELEFLCEPDEASVGSAPVRWQRFGQLLFSRPAWVCYLGLLGWAVADVVRAPDLLPRYSNVFFTDFYSLIELTLIVSVTPLLIAHECFHILAGRRIGVRSRLRISRRLYTLVLETTMDGLVAVPRRKRYLPILAGMLFDCLALAAFIVVADLTRHPDGALSFCGRLCLALAFTTLARLLWQFFFYLRTDLYMLLVTVLGCVDLHRTSKRKLANYANRLLGRTHRLVDESDWHPTDRRVAAWYAWLILVGYSVSIALLVFAIAPLVYRVLSGVFARLLGHGSGIGQLLDSVALLTLSGAQIGASLWMGRRERRREAAPLAHVIS